MEGRKGKGESRTRGGELWGKEVRKNGSERSEVGLFFLISLFILRGRVAISAS